MGKRKRLEVLDGGKTDGNGKKPGLYITVQEVEKLRGYRRQRVEIAGAIGEAELQHMQMKIAALQRLDRVNIAQVEFGTEALRTFGLDPTKENFIIRETDGRVLKQVFVEGQPPRLVDPQTNEVVE